MSRPRLTVLLRADASPSIGFGHLRRLLTLAAEIRRRGHRAIFVTRPQPGAIPCIRRAGFEALALKAPRPAAEIQSAPRLAHEVDASVVVCDIQHRAALKDPATTNAVHEAWGAGRFLVSFGGDLRGDLPGNRVVVPYLGAGRPSRRRLCGPKYFVVRPDLPRAPGREVVRHARDLLISIGGSDPTGLSEVAIEAVKGAAIPGARLRVVTGPGFTSRQSNRIRRTLPEEARIIADPKDFGRLLAGSDLLITGDGLTKYEAAAVGTPAIILHRKDTPARIRRAFGAKGSATAIASGASRDPVRLAKIIRRVAADRPARQAMSTLGQKIVDGRGAERILDSIPRRILP